MVSPQVVEKIKALADEVSRREGCLLYDIEFTGAASNRILRVYIDAEVDNVSVEQCANVSRGLSLILDVEDIIPGGGYELEVSSPGIERPLRLPWHYKKAIGSQVKVVTFDPIEGLKGETKSFTEELTGVEEAAAVFKNADGAISIPYKNIKRAQVVFGFKNNEKKR